MSNADYANRFGSANVRKDAAQHKMGGVQNMGSLRRRRCGLIERRKLAIEPLEDRRLLAIGPWDDTDESLDRKDEFANADVSVAAAGQIEVRAGADQHDLMVRFSDSGDVLTLLDAGRDQLLGTWDTAGVKGVSVLGTDQTDDSLVVELGSSLPDGVELTFDGGQGGYDKLTFNAGLSLKADYRADVPDRGRIVLSDGKATTTIVFSDLEPSVYLNDFGAIANSGLLSYGNSPEVLNVADYANASDATLEIEIGGTNPGPGVPIDDGYDQINASGEASLDGTLEVTLINDFVPSLGQTFDFLTFGSLSGAFAEVTGPMGFGDGSLYFEVVEQADHLELVVAEIPTGTALHTTTAATGRMERAIANLADDADRLLHDLVSSTPELTGEMIPGTDVTLDGLFDLTDYLDIGPVLDQYLAPIQELGSEVEFNIEEFLSYLRGNWLDNLLGGEAYDIPWSNQTFTGTGDWPSGITVEFDGSAGYVKRIPVGLSETVEGIGPAYTELEADIDASFAFSLSLGWGTSGVSYDFSVTRLELDAAASSTDLIIPLSIGDLEAAAGHPEHTTGSLDLEVHVDVALDEMADEYVVTYDPVGDPVSAVDLELPIYASLAGVDLNQGATATVGMAGDLFPASEGGRGTTAVTANPANLDDFTPFAGLRLSDVRSQLEALRDDWLDRLETADGFNVEIPFIDATLADVVDLGAAFDLAVMSKLDFEAMDSLQDFVAAATASGLIPQGEAVTYNPTTHTLTVPIDFDLSLSDLSLRDLDALGRVDLELLEDEGLIQIGAYVDPDVLLDGGYATLADLATAGVLGRDSVEDWDNIDTDALVSAGVITETALAELDLVRPGDVVSMDALIDEGLVTLGELIEAELVTPAAIIGNLGFIREAEALLSNIADFGFDLLDSAFHQADVSLVALQDLIDNSVTTLENLFAEGLLGLGDISLDALPITDLISQGIASLQDLVDEGLLTAGDFLASTAVDIADFLADTAADLGDLVTAELIDAADFAAATLVDAAAFFTEGIASLAEAVEEQLVAVDDFVDRTLSAADLIAHGLATQFELDFHDLDDGAGNVSLHDLAASGVVSLEELIEESLVDFTDLLPGLSLGLGELLDSGVAQLSQLVGSALVDVTDLATHALDLDRLLGSELASLGELVSNSLVDVADLVLDQIDIAALIESALPIGLDDLVGGGLLNIAHVTVEEFLADQVDHLGEIGGYITSGAIIDLADLLENSPIALEHLVYFGIIDHNDVRPLGDVDADVLAGTGVIDSSLLGRSEIPEIVDVGYLMVSDLVDLGLLAREDLADLPPADLDAFGFSESIIEELDGSIDYGDAIAIGDLVSQTDVSVADLLRFGLIGQGDLHADLSDVLLSDVFVQGSLDREDLLASDVLESAILDGVSTQNARGDYVIAVSDLTDLSYVTLADLIRHGLLGPLDFDLSTVTVPENDLLAWGLVTQNKLDNNNLVQDADPDVVNAGDLVALGLVGLEDLAEHLSAGELQLATSELDQADVFAADVVAINFLQSEGLGTSGPVDLEGLLATGVVDEDDLVTAGLIERNDFWDDSAVTLLAMFDAGLIDAEDLIEDTLVPLDDVLRSDAVGEKYIADAHLDDDGDGHIPIDDFLLDPHVGFAEAVDRGLLQGDRFVNKVFDLEVLEGLEHMAGDPPTLQPRFEDGQLDRIVHVGTVGLDTLLASPLYDVTLAEYVAEEFVDVHDFQNIDLDVAALEAEFGVDIDDSYVATVPLHSLIALDYDEITLWDLINEGYVGEGDLATPVVELDIRDLEASDLFEQGDLNNYISSYDVYLYDLIAEIYVGELVGFGLLESGDLIVNHLGSLGDLVDEGILGRDDFEDITLSAADLDADAVVSTTDLNALNLAHGDDVSLHDLVTSGLVSLSALIAAGKVTAADLTIEVTALDIEDIHASDILDEALLQERALITGAENDQVRLNHDTGSLLSTDTAELRDLIRGGVVDPSLLDPLAVVDKDDLVDEELATLRELIDAGLISQSDVAIASFDIEELDRVGVLPIGQLDDLDRIIALGLVTAAEVDGLGTLSSDDLIGSGLVGETDLVEAGLFGTHLDLAALLASELVTIDQLKAQGLDDRSGRVALPGLLDAAPLAVTLGDLQSEGLVTDEIDIDALLDSELVTLLDLVLGGVDKAALLAATFPGPLTITEDDLIANDLFDPNVDVARLVDSGLVTVQNLVDASLISANVDLEALADSNLVTGQQLVDAGLMTQGQLDSASYPSVGVVGLLNALLDTEDADSHLVTLHDLTYHGVLAATVDKNDLIDPSFALATGGVTVTEEDLADAGLLGDTIDVDRLVASELVSLEELEGEGLVREPLIARGDLDDLGSVDYDVLSPVWIDIDRLLASGLVGDDDRADLDDLLDTPIPALDGDTLVEPAGLVRMGLVGERDLDGHNANLFNLQGHEVSLAGDYGVTLTGMTTDALAALDASVRGGFDLLIDPDGEPATPTEGELAYSVKDFTLAAEIGVEVIDFDVAARLGLIGVTLANVPGVENRIHVDVTATAILDEDQSDATTDDRTFLLDELLDGTVVLDDNLITTVTGEATASVRGITVNAGLFGVPVGQGAEIALEVEDLTRSKSDGDYITLELRNLPGIFTIHEYFRLDDVMSAILRARDYVMGAFDQLPFFITDPNSPVYDLLPDTKIPVINKSPRELLEVIDWLDDAVERVQRALLDPDNDVQRLVEYVMDALGLDFETDSDIFSVSLEGSVIRLSLDLQADFNEDFPFDFDLAALTSLVGAGVPELEGIEDLVALEGSGNVNVKAFAEAAIEFGLDLAPRQDDLAVDKFLYDWDETTETGTRVAAGFKLLARDISLGFEVFDSIGLHTNDDGLDWDRDGVGGDDGVLYTTDATVDADGDATTNPELVAGHEDDRSDFVTVAFVLDQAGSEVPDDGKYRFDETFFGENVQFTGVDGGFELFMPLTVDVFGTEIDLTTPLHIRTNPDYITDHNEGLEQIFQHTFGLEGAGEYDPVIVDAPDITTELGNLVDSVIKGLLEDLAELIADYKEQFLALEFFDTDIPGTGYTIESFIEEASSNDNGLEGVDTATGIAAFLDIDTYIFAYLETITWIGEDSVADGTITAADIWDGLGDFLMDHWVVTLPGMGTQDEPGFFTIDSVGSEFTLAVNAPYTISRTIPLSLGTELDDVGLSFGGDLDFAFDISTGLSFDFTVDLSGEDSSFNFDEFFLSAAVGVHDVDLSISYEDVVALTTHEDAEYGDLELNLGGSLSMQDGSLTFDHEHNKAGDVTFENSVALDLPLFLVIGSGGVPLGTITFADSDFYDGELDPGFDADLTGIGGILDSAAYLALDLLGEQVNLWKEDLLPVYNADGSVASPGNEYLTRTIPGTDVSLNSLLGLDSLLSLGQYIRHYLRPELDIEDIDRDYGIPLGDPAAAGESGTDYYDQDGDPTLGGFFQYLEAEWIPTLGGGAGGLSWQPIEELGSIVGVEITFTQDFPFQRVVGFNFGEEVESIGLTVDGDMELNLDINTDLELLLSFRWDTNEVDFALDHLTFDGHASADDIVVGAEIGPLRVSIGSETCQKGVVALDLDASVSYNPDDGVTFTPRANTPTEHNNYIEVRAPIYASIGEVTFGECSDPPRLSLEGRIFEDAGGPELAFSQENMDQLLDFSDFSIGSLIGIIQSTLDWLGELTDSDFMSYEIPVINKEVGELFDFASSFSDRVLSQIDFEQIDSVQDLIEQFAEAGILPAGMDVVYDPTSRSLNLPVNFASLLNDFNLRNLQNLGQIDYQQLLDWDAIDPAALFDKDTILDGLLGMFATPLDELARWDFLTADSFLPGTSITIADLEDLQLIEAGALAGVSVSVADLLSSTEVDVDLTDLFEFDLLSFANLDLADATISFDDLIASRLISLRDLVEREVTLYAADGTTEVNDPADAVFVDLSSLLTQRAYSLADGLEMGLVAQDEFDLAGTMIGIAALHTAGLITEDERDDLLADVGGADISLSDLLDSDLVSVSLADLVGEGLVGRGDLDDLAEVAAQNLGFEGFDLDGLIDMGMLTQQDVVDFHYDIFNIEDLPLDFGFDLGDALELSTSAVADVQVTVEGGFEWVIDLDGPTGEEGLTFLINNAYVTGRASLDVDEIGVLARLGFVELTVGDTETVETDSEVHLLAEATITLDEDGNIETDDDRQFSFTDLISGGLFEHFLFDFTGFGEARLDQRGGIERDGTLDHDPRRAQLGCGRGDHPGRSHAAGDRRPPGAGPRGHHHPRPLQRLRFPRHGFHRDHRRHPHGRGVPRRRSSTAAFPTPSISSTTCWTRSSWPPKTPPPCSRRSRTSSKTLWGSPTTTSCRSTNRASRSRSTATTC